MGIIELADLNTPPNAAIIISVVSGVILLILALMVFTAIWIPRDRSFSALANWRPKYLALDSPFIPPPLTAKSQRTAVESEEDEPKFEEILTSKVFYDRLEDQTLQMTSKIESHQNELDMYFRKLRSQKQRLNDLLKKIENQVDQAENTETNQMETSGQYSQDQTINVQQNIVSYTTQKDKQLMKALQQILNAYNQGRVVVTDDMVEKSLIAVGKDKNSENNVVEMLVANQTQKELELNSTEVQEISDLIIELDEEYKQNLETLNRELENNLEMADADRRALLLAKYAEDRDALRSKYESDRARQIRLLQEKLANKRKLENEALQNEVKLKTGHALEISSNDQTGNLALEIETVLNDEVIDIANVEECLRNDYAELINDFSSSAQQKLDPIQFESFNAEIGKALAAKNQELDQEKESVTVNIRNRRRKKRREKLAEAEDPLFEQRDINDENREVRDFLTAHHNMKIKAAKDIYTSHLAKFEQDGLLDEFNQQADLMADRQRTERLKQQKKLQETMMRRRRKQLNELKTVDEAHIKDQFSGVNDKINTESNVPVAYQTTIEKQAAEKKQAVDELDQAEQEAAEKLRREQSVAEEKAKQELKRKQDAERNARTMTADELALLQNAHQAQLEELEERHEKTKSHQQKLLDERLAKRRKEKLDQIDKEQTDELAGEKEKAQAKQSEEDKEKLAEEEKQRISAAIAANNGQNNARLVENILSGRQENEIMELQAKWDHQLDLEYAEIDKSDLTAVEKEAKKQLAANKIKLLHSNELVDLKNCHYQEKLDILTEVAPATAQQVEAEKAQYEQTLAELEVKRQENESRREQERSEWEAAEKLRLENEMNAFEAELEQQLAAEQLKIEEELRSKAQQQAVVHEKQKELMEAELKAKISGTSSETQKKKLVEDFNNQMNRAQDQVEADKLRMNDQLRKRLQARRNELVETKTQEIEAETELRKTTFEAELAEQESEEIKIKPKKNTGPLTDQNIDQLLSESEVCLSLKEIQNHLRIQEQDPSQFGDTESISVNSLSELELTAYNICLYLLDLLQKEWSTGCVFEISEKVPKIDRHIEFSSLHSVNGSNLTLQRGLLSDSAGKMIVVLCYAFARIVAEQKKLNLQTCFYKTQMMISDQMFSSFTS